MRERPELAVRPGTVVVGEDHTFPLAGEVAVECPCLHPVRVEVIGRTGTDQRGAPYLFGNSDE